MIDDKLLNWFELLSEIDPVNLMNRHNYGKAVKEFMMKDLELDIKVSTVGEDDRADLEGRIITVLDIYGGKTSGVIVGCNKSVGLTIVNANDKDKYLICMRGPVAPNSTVHMHTDYDVSWTTVIEMLEAGIFDVSELHRLHKGDGTGGSLGAHSCAYNQ